MSLVERDTIAERFEKRRAKVEARIAAAEQEQDQFKLDSDQAQQIERLKLDVSGEVARAQALQHDLFAAEQRAKVAEAERDRYHELLKTRTEQANTLGAEAIRLTQQLADRDATIRTQGEEIERLKDEIVWMQQRAERAEATIQRLQEWVADEQAKRHAAEDARVQAHSELAYAHAEVDSLIAEIAKKTEGYERMWSALQAESTTHAEVRGELRAQVATLEAEVADLTKARRLAEYDRLRQRP